MKKDIDAKCYELTLTPNYVSDWTFNDALRELIQNGTDQEVLDKENKFQIIYNEKEKTLRLVNQKSVLKINTLLLGRSSKANNEDTVGQFGEGYKIAALVLNRLGRNEMAVGKMYLQELLQSKLAGRESLLIHMG